MVQYLPQNYLAVLRIVFFILFENEVIQSLYEEVIA